MGCLVIILILIILAALTAMKHLIIAMVAGLVATVISYLILINIKIEGIPHIKQHHMAMAISLLIWILVTALVYNYGFWQP